MHKNGHRGPTFRLLAGLAVTAFWLPALLTAEDSAGTIDGIYRGTIGHQQVVLEVSRIFAGAGGADYGDPYDQPTYPIKGSYFYRRHGVSISLAGMPLDDGSVRLREYRQLDPLPYEFTADWRMRFSGNRAIGMFCKCDLSGSVKPARPVLTVTLRRVSKKLTPPDSWQGYKPHTNFIYYDLLLDFPVKVRPGNAVLVIADSYHTLMGFSRKTGRQKDGWWSSELASDGTHFYVVRIASGDLLSIEPESGQVAWSLRLPRSSLMLGIHGGLLFTSDAVVDLSTRKVTHRWPEEPHGK